MKNLLPIAGLALVLSACRSESPRVPQNLLQLTTPAIELRREPVQWTALRAGTGSTGLPVYTLILSTGDSRQELYRTVCLGNALTGIPDMDRSLSTAQCTWNGSGSRFGVFLTDNDGIQAVIRRRTLSDKTGFGPWEDVKPL